MEKETVKKNEFKCDCCDGVFEHKPQEEWSEQDKLDELHGLFGDISLSDCASVCDDCFKEMGLED